MDNTKPSWVKRRVLGKGSYGTVFLASPLNFPSKIIAVKSTDMQLSSSLREEEQFLYELRGCPEIISCFGDDISVEKGKYIFNLLLEYAPGGTLADLIKNRCISVGTVPEWEVSWYTYLLLLGLQHIHEKGCVHCDFKPENILVFPTRDGTLNHVKIADLGLAKKAGCDSTRPIFVNGCWYNHRGTPLYSSPESVLFGLHESPMDIWSLGCIVMEMLTGTSAYPRSTCSSDGDSLEDLLLQISFDVELPKLPDQDNISVYAKDFLRRCFVRNPRKRWTANQLLNHPFIVEHLKILRGLGVITNPNNVSMMNPIAPTPWRSGTSLFFDPSTMPAACTSSAHQRNYRAALLKGLP